MKRGIACYTVSKFQPIKFGVLSALICAFQTFFDIHMQNAGVNFKFIQNGIKFVPATYAICNSLLAYFECIYSIPAIANG
jgi:hypothetical protein